MATVDETTTASQLGNGIKFLDTTHITHIAPAAASTNRSAYSRLRNSLFILRISSEFLPPAPQTQLNLLLNAKSRKVNASRIVFNCEQYMYKGNAEENMRNGKKIQIFGMKSEK